MPAHLASENSRLQSAAGRPQLALIFDGVIGWMGSSLGRLIATRQQRGWTTVLAVDHCFSMPGNNSASFESAGIAVSRCLTLEVPIALIDSRAGCPPHPTHAACRAISSRRLCSEAPNGVRPTRTLATHRALTAPRDSRRPQAIGGLSAVD